jgi:hypothetical protein
MASVKLSLFNKNKTLEAQIDEFLDTVSQGGILFEETMRHFTRNGVDELYTQRLQQISDIESTGDRLVKAIVTELYSEMLIPESRADVLSLLQDIDCLLDQYKQTCYAVDIECVRIDDLPQDSSRSFSELVAVVVQSVEVLIAAARAFFRDINAVRDSQHKVGFLEGEADKVADQLKRDIFRSDLALDRKMHLRYFIDMVDSIADEAEETADWLAIYTIKRAL